MTVSELKHVLSQWPETHLDGTPCEVWISDGEGLSSEALITWPLNVRADEGTSATYDLLIAKELT